MAHRSRRRRRAFQQASPAHDQRDTSSGRKRQSVGPREEKSAFRRRPLRPDITWRSILGVLRCRAGTARLGSHLPARVAGLLHGVGPRRMAQGTARYGAVHAERGDVGEGAPTMGLRTRLARSAILFDSHSDEKAMKRRALIVIGVMATGCVLHLGPSPEGFEPAHTASGIGVSLATS